MFIYHRFELEYPTESLSEHDILVHIRDSRHQKTIIKSIYFSAVNLQKDCTGIANLLIQFLIN